MKRSILLMVIAGMILFSCKKDNSDIIPVSIEGTWKMVAVKDNSTNVSITKPSSIAGDVIITFASNNITSGIFSGKTPSNFFGLNDYKIGPGQAISIPVLAVTKVGETLWGLEFTGNIRDALKYGFERGEKLNIITKDKTLTFAKQ